MLFTGHLLFGILFFLLGRDSLLQMGGNELILFLIVLLAAIFPDIDEQDSKINKWSGALGRIAINIFKHRGVLHSLLFFGTISLLIGMLVGESYGYAIILGYFAHIFADGITPMGVDIFYPIKKRLSGPIRVGSFYEYVLTVILFFVVIWLVRITYFA